MVRHMYGHPILILYTKRIEMYSDIMVDLETLGTTHDSVITQIGACYFDRLTGDINSETLLNVEIGSCIKSGMKVTAGSIKFWLEHKPTFLDNAIPIEKALSIFGEFVGKGSLIWCHATFDAVILANAYHMIDQGIPFSYRNIRDIRTLVDLSGYIREKKDDNKDLKTHDALEDCKFQVKYCVECFNLLSKSK